MTNEFTHFAIKAEYPDGAVDVRILQGDHTKDLAGQYTGKSEFRGFGFGPLLSTMCAYPHFSSVTFIGEFPIAKLIFADDTFPAEITLTAFNPFIPHEDDDSSIPAAFFDITVKSLRKDVKFTLALSAANPFEKSENLDVSSDGINAVMLRHAGKSTDDKDYGDITIAVSGGCSSVQKYWYRGGWQDGVATYWRELCEGPLSSREYVQAGTHDVATVFTALPIADEASARFALGWNIPNCYNYWSDGAETLGTWKNYYSTIFEDSAHSAKYALANFDRLHTDTLLFKNTLHGATLDGAVIDAVSSTLSVLKSATVLRLSDGRFYGWEGLHEREGSCEGTCTHVWSYVYALAHLFPSLERSVTETKFDYDTRADGGMVFRTQLPLRKNESSFRPCLDGQMASVFKLYREWKLGASEDWLKKYYGKAMEALDYATSPENPDEWDINSDGILEGRQHHTLDMELFGPSAWLEGMYLLALKAGSRLAKHMGDEKRAAKYDAMYENGYSYTRQNLFNGKYFIQNVDLSCREYTEKYGCPEYWNAERGQLKYQIGEGCEIDSLLAQWHSNLIGLGDIFDKEQRRRALEFMYSVLYKPSMRHFANAWRVFALNDEGGAVMCDYPKGAYRPYIPIPYSDECMTGFEYSFAGLLISEGFINEGLSIVRAVRDRYDGEKRNPYNEIECGSNYARAMASFSLLQIFSGFSYDIPEGFIGFEPRLQGEFRCPFYVCGAWGELSVSDSGAEIAILKGQLKLSSVNLNGIAEGTLYIDGIPTEYEVRGGKLYFESCTVNRSLKISGE